MTTMIRCSKSDFAKVLRAEYAEAFETPRNEDTINEIDALVGVANAHRGTIEGHNEWLDLNYQVWPDEYGDHDHPKRQRCGSACPVVIAAETAPKNEDPRNPAVVHYWGADRETLCGMTARDLDGTHHRAIDSYDGDSTCAQCDTYVQQVIDDAAAETAPKFAEGEIVTCDGKECVVMLTGETYGLRPILAPSTAGVFWAPESALSQPHWYADVLAAAMPKDVAARRYVRAEVQDAASALALLATVASSRDLNAEDIQAVADVLALQAARLRSIEKY